MNPKVALVTGAGSGLGRGIALKLAQAGAKVVVSDVVAASGEETAHLIASAGGEAIFVRSDVSLEEDVAHLVNRAVSHYGRLDWACNNAGILGPQVPIFEYDSAQFDRVMAVNCRGVFLGLRYQLPVLIGQGSGAIVNIASECSVKGAAANCAYTASKHAVHGLTKNAALTVAKTGVRVNAVAGHDTQRHHGSSAARTQGNGQEDHSQRPLRGARGTRRLRALADGRRLAPDQRRHADGRRGLVHQLSRRSRYASRSEAPRSVSLDGREHHGLHRG
jgi:NAD(P)-dependent dehydrogenase (short-subunit alcohol dehydrogenase family)